jgi:hypothetical protein
MGLRIPFVPPAQPIEEAGAGLTTIELSSAPVEAIEPGSVVSLGAGDGSFHAPLPDEAGTWWFSSTDGSIAWDEKDKDLIDGLDATEAIAAIANGSKVVAIGSSSQQFRLDGDVSAGPLIYRSPGLVMVHRAEGSNLYEVTLSAGGVSVGADAPSEVTAEQIEAGTETTPGTISAKTIKDAIDAKAAPGWLADAATIADRDALADVKVGHKIRVLDAGDTRWAVFEARGDSPDPNWFQLTDEDNLNSPLPNLSSTDAIAGTATTQSLISAATLKSATDSANRWPTIQASIDKDVTIASGTVPSLIHLNSGTRPGNAPWITRWDVSAAADGEHHLVQAFGQARALTIAGATSIRVNGSVQTGNVVTLGAGVNATVTHTLNAGQRFVNVLSSAVPTSDLVAPPIFVGTTGNIDGVSGYVFTTVTNTMAATNNGAAGVALPPGRYRISITGQKASNSGEHRGRVFNAAGQTLGQIYVTANISTAASFDYTVTAQNDFIRVTRDFSTGNGNIDNAVLTITRVDSMFAIDPRMSVLSPRQITGAGIVGAIGYDGVPVPVSLTIPRGTSLATVSATNNAVATISNASAGIVNVTVSGAATALTWTTTPNATYTGLQRLGVDTSISFTSDGANIATDLNFTNAEWAVVRVTESTDRKTTFWLRLDTAATTERHGMWLHDTWWGEFKIINKAAGTISFSDTGISFSVDLVEAWANAANGFVTPSSSTILTQRTISGAINGMGYDNVALAYPVDVPVGRRLATVTATGGAIAEITNAIAGSVTITPNGANTSIAVTTEAAHTYTGLQTVAGGTRTLQLSTTGKSFDVGAVLRENDLLSFTGDYNDNPAAETHILNYRVRAGQAMRVNAWPAADHIVTVTFPSPLTNTVSVTHGGGNGTFRLRSWVVLRDELVTVAVPEASVLLSPRTISGDVSGIGYDDVAFTYAYDLPAGRRLATVTATGGAIVSIANPSAGVIRITPKGADTAIAVTTGADHTFTGLQRIGEYRVSPVDIESANLTATGLDMRFADKLQITLQHSSTSAFQSSGTVYPTYSDFIVDLAQLRGAANGYAWLPLDGGYVQVRVMNFTTGDLRWEDQSQGAQFIAASTWSEAANGYYVPAGTALATPRTITATLDGVATTLNGDTQVIRAEGSTAMLRIPLAANRRLSAATGALLEAPESGIIRVNVGAADASIVATSEIYRRSVTANVNVNGGASATVEANVPTVIQLEVPNNQQITGVTATNGAARPIGGAGAVEVIPNNAGDMALTATLAALSPNLADSSLGTIDGSDSGSAKFVQNRTNARIKEMTFTFRDRRPEQSARTTTVTVPANAFGGASGTNWTLRFENSFRYGISRTYSLGGIDYLALIQWVPLPTGYMFWFQEAHSNVWNTYGRFENVTIKWEAQ